MSSFIKKFVIMNLRRANDEIWTRDLFLTKETLYPWATSAENLSERPGSNRRHSAWKADALPTELLSLKYLVGRAGFEPAKLKTADLQSALVGRLSISPLF